jgi:hypothetical protein
MLAHGAAILTLLLLAGISRLRSRRASPLAPCTLSVGTGNYKTSYNR